MPEDKPPLPPFTAETAAQKVQAAEDAWNTRDPNRVAQAYTVDSAWRNRDVFVTGRDEIVQFLTRKWERELDYALRKNLWCFDRNRIAVRFQYESHDRDGQWWREPTACSAGRDATTSRPRTASATPSTAARAPTSRASTGSTASAAANG